MQHIPGLSWDGRVSWAAPWGQPPRWPPSLLFAAGLQHKPRDKPRGVIHVAAIFRASPPTSQAW